MNTLIIELIISVFISVSIFFWSKYLVTIASVRSFIVRNKVFHPNSISYFRIPLWFFAILLFHYEYEILAILLFTFAAITDAVDGIIARSCNLCTDLGKSLDPLSDKLVYFAPILYFWFIWKISLILVLSFVILDTLWQFSRVLLKKMNLETKANNYGKFKTTFVFILIFYLMIFENKDFINSEIFYNNILMWFALFFAFLSILFKFIKR